jgi:DNA-binding transcriptional MerR regulator
MDRALDDDPHVQSTPADVPDFPLTIAETAREFGVTLRALRFYERKGLLCPMRCGEVRSYGRRERERLSLIIQGRRLGFTLAEIADLIAPRSGERTGLRLSRAGCIEQLKLLERRRREIEAAIAELRQIYTSLYADPDARARRLHAA